MTTLVLRGIAERKLRSALSAIAVLLGVAMIAGTYIETDQIRTAFEDITESSVSKIDVILTPEEEFTSAFTQPPTLDDKLVNRVRRIPGVAAAEGQVGTFGQLVVDGETVDTFGAPGLVVSDASERFDPTEIVAGRDPFAPGEAAVIQQNAEDQGIEVGDRIGVVTRHGVKHVTVVGIFSFGEGGSSVGGATVVELQRRQAQQWFDMEGEVSSVSVIADPGVDPGELAGRIEEAVPGDIKVQTAEENAQESADEINDQIGSFLTPALLALAGAAVLVGAFIIFNTFSITVAQRTREFAMLRALGATRRQVLAIVTGEALVVGAVASAAGIGAGILFSKVLNALFDAVGFGIPRTGLTLAPRTVAIALTVGIGVTLVAALVPAFRATRVAPVVAMSGEAPAPSRRRRRITAAIAIVVTLAGLGLAAQGLFGSGAATSRLGAVGGGTVLVFIGVALAARYAVRPLAAVIGYPIERLFKTPGRLARENAERNPSRTAITSAALMVGVGLVVFVAVFAAGLKSSIGRQVDELVRAQFFVYSTDFQPFAKRTVRLARSVEGVGTVVPTLYDVLKVNGEKSNVLYDIVIGVDPHRLTDVYTFEWVDGEDSLLAHLGRNETLIEEQFSKAHDVGVGDTYEVLTPSGGRATFRAVGTYRDPTILQGSIASARTVRAISPARDPVFLLVSVAGGADPGKVEAALERRLDAYPNLKVENRAEYQQTIEDQLNQIIYLLYALLAMSLVISLFGIANSLFLSIHERTGEIGVLRAIGATAAQLRRVIRYESVITSTIGGLLGTAIGVLFGCLVIESLSEFGFGVSIPVGQLVVFMLLAVFVGVLGAIAPARRASRMDVLEAIHHE